MFNLVQKTVIMASVILSTAAGSVCENFAVHAGTAITFAASTINGGDVGASSISGTYGIVDGTVASAGDSALFTASVYDSWFAAMQIQNNAMAFAIEMGGETFTPGTWRSSSINIAAGTEVILDGEDDPNSVFLFQSVGTMLTGAGSKIILTNGAKAENVLWAIDAAVTFGADTVLEGSILAGTAITFGAANEVYGCVVAITGAITFGAANYVKVVQAADNIFADESAPAAFFNGDDEIIIACMPLTEAAPAACAALPVDVDAAMEAMLNSCSQQGIYNTIAAQDAGSTGVTMSSGSDIPQLEGAISIVPTIDDEGGRRARNLRGAGQEERSLFNVNFCYTTRPSMAIVLYCCWNPNAFSYCGGGAPMTDGRRALTTTTSISFESPSVATTGTVTSRTLQAAQGSILSAAQMEQYLPSISIECTRQFIAQAELYLGMNQDAACFAAASEVPDLKCYAIVVTGGLPLPRPTR
jgi:hypothetical protein